MICTKMFALEQVSNAWHFPSFLSHPHLPRVLWSVQAALSAANGVLSLSKLRCTMLGYKYFLWDWTPFGI